MDSEDEFNVWKTFLHGRIAQEEGNDEEALRAFNKALQASPENPHFVNSKAIALQRLHRTDEDKLAFIQQRYEQLATTLVGESDRAQDWILGLKAALAEAEGASPPSVATVAW